MTTTVLTERRNPNTSDIDLMTSEQIAQTINQEDMKIAVAIQKVIPQIGEAIELIADAFRQGGRLAYFGAGTSGRLGVLDASECWPTFGVEHGMVNGYIAGGEVKFNDIDLVNLPTQELYNIRGNRISVILVGEKLGV